MQTALAMLPKPDGEARAIYTGVLHPSVISNCALGLSLHFDELLIEHPFIHPRTVNKEFSPLEHPENLSPGILEVGRLAHGDHAAGRARARYPLSRSLQLRFSLARSDVENGQVSIARHKR